MAHAECGSVGILQVHPTRFCNLACAHCYSSSSPSVRERLPAHAIVGAIEDAAALGFGVVSLSGGEPLAYHDLGIVVDAALSVGSRVSLVSNGLLIGSRQYEALAGKFHLVALSLDGLEDRHNTIRRSTKAFAAVREAANTLRRSQQPFGIIHTLSSESLPEIEALAQLAADWGASLLQLHPFEPAGRGAGLSGVSGLSGLSGMTALSSDDRLDAYLLAALLQARFPELRVQLDLVHRDVARYLPAALHGASPREPLTPHELVLQDDGRIVPLTFGLDPAWAVANLNEERLSAAWPSFLDTTWPQLRRRLRTACIATARGHHGDIVAWHALVRQYAQTPARAPLFNLSRSLSQGTTWNPTMRVPAADVNSRT